MPIRILVIGLLFCLAGALAIWEVVADLMLDHLNLNFGVFLLPVGIGLLRGRSSSRAWAKFWIVLGYLLVVLIVGFSIANTSELTADWFGEKIRGSQALPYVLAMAALLFVTLLVVHLLLNSRKSTEFFERRQAEREARNAPPDPGAPVA